MDDTNKEDSDPFPVPKRCIRYRKMAKPKRSITYNDSKSKDEVPLIKMDLSGNSVDQTIKKRKYEIYNFKKEVIAASDNCSSLSNGCISKLKEDDSGKHRSNLTKSSPSKSATSEIQNDMIPKTLSPKTISNPKKSQENKDNSRIITNTSPKNVKIESSRNTRPFITPEIFKNKFFKLKRALMDMNLDLDLDLEEYTSATIKNRFPDKKPVISFCQRPLCIRRGILCSKITTEQKNEIINQFYSLADTKLKQGFITTHVSVFNIKTATTGQVSRRKKTRKYYFTIDGRKEEVCQKFFISTLGVTEKQVRNALEREDEDD